MNHTQRMFQKAAQLAAKDTKGTKRQYRHAAIGIRNDGTTVTATNIPSRDQTPHCHAETRLARKLDQNATIYIVRITANGKLTTSRPCRHCRKTLHHHKVKTIHYTINQNEYGTITF